MKLNHALYSSILLTGTLVIAGCGSDSDSGTVGSDQSGNNPVVNNEFKYSVYDIFDDLDNNNNYKTAWGKLKYTLSNNGVKEELSTVVGNSATSYQDSRSKDNDYLDYYAGNNFFIAVNDDFDDRYYKINFTNKDSFKLKISKDNATINSTYDILTYDITGVRQADSYAKTGFHTDLHYDYFPSNIAFPAGSQCYILQETSEQSYYNFDNTDTGYDSLEQWLENERRASSQINTLVKENVGQNNSLQAIKYTDQDGDSNAAVFFNNRVYDATYVEKGVKQVKDIDPKTSSVYCDSYNDVAAAFLDEQIKINYR